MAALALPVMIGIAPTRGPAAPDPSFDPGPFWPLVVGHRGERYVDSLPGNTTYQIVSGRLPRGLSLSRTTVSGTPSETGTFEVRLRAFQSGTVFPFRLSVTVREPDESGFAGERARSFEQSGPFSVDVFRIAPELRSGFDDRRFTTNVRLALPRGNGPFPLLLYHRGRGFDEDSYTAFHELIASHGIAVASVEDRLSFAGDSFLGQISSYDFDRAELGMQSASAVVEAVGDYLLARSADPSDGLAGVLDPDNVFAAGHSRGGGAVHASHQRSFRLRYKGIIYLMAFDLRFFRECRPPGVSPAYGIDDDLQRVPSLIIAAENDGDLTYPIADQLIDRATGPTTQVTVYGGVHNLISDSHRAEGNARISRTQQTRRVADWITCFVRRWAFDETDLERRLYGDAHQDSSIYAVASWRPSARTLLVEDAQDADTSRNRLGRNLVANLRRRERSYYPNLSDFGSLRLAHTHLTPVEQVSIWRMAFDQVQNVSAHERITMRLAQSGSRGWSWATLWLRVIDADGDAAYQRIYTPAGGVLPVYDGLSPQDRFIDVHVDIDDFFVPQGGGSLQTSRLIALDLFVVVEDARFADEVIVDQVRFE